MIDFPDCPCSGGTLDKLIQPAILAVLAEETAHGYRIAEKISQMPSFGGEKPDVSGIYRLLKGMEAKRMVVSSWDTPDKGHAKRLYELTSNGKACLIRWAATLENYVATITSLLKVTQAVISEKSGKKCCCSGKRSSKRAATPSC